MVYLGLNRGTERILGQKVGSEFLCSEETEDKAWLDLLRAWRNYKYK